MLSWFYSAVANSIVGIHAGISHLVGRTSGWAWGLSIVLLVVAIRILLFPLFVKQIRTQRAMSELAPKIKELQQKYRGDRETLNTELMKLYREHNANPLGGCLPILVQFPIFIALFRVLNSFKPSTGPNGEAVYKAHYGISESLVHSAAQAKILGAPIASSFRSSTETLGHLHASSGTVKIVTVALIVVMTATTFITQRQLIAKNAATAGTPMAQQQKILLYVFPPMFALFGINFPVGVLLYWVTTNFWTMGQQFLVINRMTPAGAAAAGTPKPGGTKPIPAAGKAVVEGGAPAPVDGDGADGSGTSATSPGTARTGGGSPAKRPANRNAKRKRNRRGGRR